MAGLKIRKSRKQNIANRFHSEIRWVSVVDIAALLGNTESDWEQDGWTHLALMSDDPPRGTPSLNSLTDDAAAVLLI
jgi:hypothetical protein